MRHRTAARAPHARDDACVHPRGESQLRERAAPIAATVGAEGRGSRAALEVRELEEHKICEEALQAEGCWLPGC